MNGVETATQLGDAMMSGAHAWLDLHESSSDHERVVGLVVSVCPESDDSASFVVGATHDIRPEAMVEILLRVMNNLVPPESQLRLVVTPRTGGQG